MVLVGAGEWVSHAKTLIDEEMKAHPKSFELDLAPIGNRARKASYIGMEGLKIKEASLKELPLMIGEIKEERALRMLNKRIAKGV
jgi:hypothetical protein